MNLLHYPLLALVLVGLVFAVSACDPDEGVGPGPTDDDDDATDDDDTGDDDTVLPGSCEGLEALGWTPLDELGVAMLDRSVPISSVPVGGASYYAPPHPHMFAAPDPEVGVVLGWASSGGGVHLTLVDGLGEPTGDEFEISGVAIHGLAVSDDGYGVLVHRLPDELTLVEVSRTGEIQFERTVLSGDYWWQTTWWMST